MPRGKRLLGESPRAERTSTSVRAERAYQDWTALPPSKRPLARGRVRVAELLDELLHERWLHGDDAYSNSALAARYVDVTEKTVRQWRAGEKSIPLAALLALPEDLVEDLVDRVLTERRQRQGDRRAVVALDRAVARIAAHVENTALRRDDRVALRSALTKLGLRISEVVASLYAEDE